MKIRVEDVEANPFRNMDNYPINRDKVDHLKTSIKETSFWDNILARPKPNESGKYQLAYGHHRWIALRELEIEEIDIPVRDLDDVTMIKIMANENLTEWSSSTIVINETVLVAKQYLDEQLKGAEWTTLNEVIKSLFKDSRGFKNAQAQGVGQTVIVRFLGRNWKQWMVQAALDTLSNEHVDRRAVEKFDSLHAAEKFKQAVWYKLGRKIAKPVQLEYAEEIAVRVNKGEISPREIGRIVTHIAEQERKKMRAVSDWDLTVHMLREVSQAARTLDGKIGKVCTALRKQKIEKLSGLSPLAIFLSLKQLAKSMQKLGEYFKSNDPDDIANDTDPDQEHHQRCLPVGVEADRDDVVEVSGSGPEGP